MFKTAIKIGVNPVIVPDCWEDLSCEHYFSIKKAITDLELFSAATGIDIQDCEKIPIEVIASLLQPLSFIAEQELPQIEVSEVCGLKVPAKIGTKEFARKVNCDLAFKKLKGEELLFRIVAVYCCPGIEDEDITAFEKELLNERLIIVLSAGKVLIEQLAEIRKSEAKIPEPEYEHEEISAGVKDFKIYGVFGLVRSIAMKYHCQIDDVYKMPYNRVLMELKYSADENRYQRRLNRNLARSRKVK